MSEDIRWPPIVQTIRTHLDTALAAGGFAGVKAVGRVPPKRPRRFVRVLRAGGRHVDLITMEPLVLIESWSSSDESAEALADFVHSVMLRAGRSGWLADTPLRRMGVASIPQSLPDPVSGQDRYSAMYAPQLRGHVL